MVTFKKIVFHRFLFIIFAPQFKFAEPFIALAVWVSLCIHRFRTDTSVYPDQQKYTIIYFLLLNFY